MPFFNALDGTRLYFESAGADNAQVLLCIHGWTLDSRMWSPLVPFLSDHYRVITYDRRGFGRSLGEPSKSKDIEDIDALIEQLGMDKVNLIGMSQGGRVALNYYLKHPIKVSTLILQGSQVDGYSPEGPEHEKIPIEKYQQLVLDGSLTEFKTLWLAHPLMAVPATSTGVKQLVEAMVGDYQARDLHQNLDNLRAYEVDTAEYLSDIQCPALIIDGDTETTGLKRVAEKLFSEIPQSVRKTIYGGGHLIGLIEPECFSEAVKEFLKTESKALLQK